MRKAENKVAQNLLPAKDKASNNRLHSLKRQQNWRTKEWYSGGVFTHVTLFCIAEQHHSLCRSQSQLMCTYAMILRELFPRTRPPLFFSIPLRPMLAVRVQTTRLLCTVSIHWDAIDLRHCARCNVLSAPYNIEH